MRALRPTGDGTASIDRSHDAPTPGPGEALVRPTLGAVRPLDLLLASARTGAPGPALGGSCVGVVESDGDAPARGRRVLVGGASACGACDLCRGGLSAHCRGAAVLGVDRSGSFADRLAAPRSALVEAPDALTDDAAALAETVGAAMHAARQAPVERRGYVTVLGDSALALLCAQLLVRRNDAVRLLARHPSRIDLCERWGVRCRPIDEAGRRGDQDVVVVGDAGADVRVLSAAMALARPRAEIIIAGGDGAGALAPGPAPRATAPTGPDPWRELVRREFRVIGSRAGALREAVTALANAEIDVGGLITRRVRLDDAPAALAAATDPAHIAVVVEI